MNRDFLITGAAQGLGLEFSRRILTHGGRVFMADIDKAKGEASRDKLQADFGKDKVDFAVMDVTKEEEWRRVWSEAESFFGGYVEALCNNAGVAGDDWKKTQAVNMTGAMYGGMLALEKMGVSKGGRGGLMVVTCSTASYVAGRFPSVEHATYNSSKHAMLGFVKGFTGEPYKIDNVRVLGLCPTFTDTNIVRSNMTDEQIRSIKTTFGIDLMTPQEVGQAFESLVLHGKSGDSCVVTPHGSFFMWPNFNRQLLFIMAHLTRFTKKALGLPSTEIVGGCDIMKGGVLVVLLLFVLLHLALRWMGL